MTAEIRTILEELEEAGRPSRDHIMALLRTADESLLFASADTVREQHLGNDVHLRGIIEFSNHCVKNCLYCGLRRDNRELARYRMSVEEILATAQEGVRAGLKTIVLQSGEDPFFTGDMLAHLIGHLKERCDVAITMSVGDRTKGDYRIMREAGADRYLLKHETSDPLLFGRLRPGTKLAERVKRLYWLKELGFQVGSGTMVGLPGQELETMADDIMLMRELAVEMAGIGPFIPHPNTPLSGARGGDVKATLRVLAVARLALPRTHLPATTALATIHPEGRQMALRCGANVVMPDITPVHYKTLYEIYPNKAGVNEEGATTSIPFLAGMIAGSGRTVAAGYGHGFRYEKERSQE